MHIYNYMIMIIFSLFTYKISIPNKLYYIKFIFNSGNIKFAFIFNN